MCIPLTRLLRFPVTPLTSKGQRVAGGAAQHSVQLMALSRCFLTAKERRKPRAAGDSPRLAAVRGAGGREERWGAAERCARAARADRGGSGPGEPQDGFPATATRSPPRHLRGAAPHHPGPGGAPPPLLKPGRLRQLPSLFPAFPSVFQPRALWRDRAGDMGRCGMGQPGVGSGPRPAGGMPPLDEHRGILKPLPSEPGDRAGLGAASIAKGAARPGLCCLVSI